MDFWVVAAVTGAGYVAKHWQSFSGEQDSPSEVSSPRVQLDAQQVFDKTPNSVFPLPNLARIRSSEKKHNEHQDFGSDPMEKQVFQGNSDEINQKYDFRTTNTNCKSFSSVRPLVVTNNIDARRKQTTQTDDIKDHNNIVFIKDKKAVYGPTGSAKLPRRPKQTHSQGDNMAPLFLGITIGVLSTKITNQREIEHLNELLERAEGMVRDLQNTLEAKAMFTSGSKADNLELTSDIEAELEAELEILEEKMNGYTVQIDTDYEAETARGDVNLDALTWQVDSQSGSDQLDQSYEPVFTPTYVVSSLDLRLRLHEVIESELQARVDQLESILENQTKPRSPDPQAPNSFWDFDHTRIESSSSTP